MREQAVLAAKKCIQRRNKGVEVFTQPVGFLTDLVFVDELDDVHFVCVNYSCYRMPQDVDSNYRGILEQEAAEWLIDNDVSGKYQQVHFDSVSLHVLNNNRALLRYHHDCME